MTKPLSPRIARTLQFLLIPFWLIMIGHWSLEIIRGVPDAYGGQHYGGLFISIGSLFAVGSSVVPHSRWRIAMMIGMWVFLIPALYYIFSKH